MTQRTPYGFEHIFALNSAADFDKDDHLYKRFLRNLVLEEDDLGEPARARLKRYIANVHISARWYNRKVRHEKFMQTFLFIVSVSLLIIVPTMIYFAPEFLSWIRGIVPFVTSDDTTNSGEFAETSARLTTFLAGFYAAHRAVSGWANQRKLIGPYWQARSSLLEETYALETKWGNLEKDRKVSDKDLTDEFSTAIGESLTRARTAIQSERAQFFSNYTFPDVNIADSLKSAATAATGTISAFESPQAKLQKVFAAARDERIKKIQNLKSEIAGLSAVLQELEAELASKKAERDQAAIGSDEKKSLDTEVTALLSEIAKVKTQRRIKLQLHAQEQARL